MGTRLALPTVLQSKTDKIVQTLGLIPSGKVASYGQIADLAGLPGRARLGGKVLREQASLYQLPWFRIVRANGQLAFPAHSPQADTQKALLAEEKVEVIKGRVDMTQYGWQPSLADILFKLEQ